jgi:hypothetical protein
MVNPKPRPLAWAGIERAVGASESPNPVQPQQCNQPQTSAIHPFHPSASNDPTPSPPTYDSSVLKESCFNRITSPLII